MTRGFDQVGGKMSGEKENMLNPELYALAENSAIIRELLDYREQLLTIALDDVLSEEHSKEDLEGLADQYEFIGLQLRAFREDCGPRGTQMELDVVDDILLELRNEIAVHTAMIKELIWAKSSTTGASGGGEPPDDQLTRELKWELAILKVERDREESTPPEADFDVETVTDGAKALNLSNADVREMAESKTEASEPDEVKVVETKLKELRQAYEDAVDEYRSNPKKGLLDKKESLFEIAKRLALLENDCHFLQDNSRREKAG